MLNHIYGKVNIRVFEYSVNVEEVSLKTVCVNVDLKSNQWHQSSRATLAKQVAQAYL